MTQIPKTDSIEELARFWDTHDLTDFEDQLEEVEDPVFQKAENRTVVRVLLHREEADALHRLARSKGIEDDKLVREWISEKLAAS
jgi:hypothetical protein